MSEMSNRLQNDEFFRLREEVLTQWPTGADVDFDEAVAFHKALPENKLFSLQMQKAEEEGRTLIQPRAGVPLVRDHIELLTYLQNEGGADLLPTTIDSYTRQNRYKEAEIGIEESVRENKSMLNGFPAVNHGVGACRQIIQSLDRPVQVRHGTPESRLLAEITLAGVFTRLECGGISYNMPYSKNGSL